MTKERADARSCVNNRQHTAVCTAPVKLKAAHEPRIMALVLVQQYRHMQIDVGTTWTTSSHKYAQERASARSSGTRTSERASARSFGESCCAGTQ